MKKQPPAFALIAILILSILPGCSKVNTKDNIPDSALQSSISVTHPVIETTPTTISTPSIVSESPSYSPNPETTVAPFEYPLYLPLPRYETFYSGHQGGNIDAFLHNTVVDYYSTRVSSKSGTLLIPSMRLLDEWDAGDGSTYYLCHWVQYDYYELAQLLLDGGTIDELINGGPGYSITGGLIRFKVTPMHYSGAVESYWGFKAVEILESPPWGTNGGDIKELCGGRPIADSLYEAYNVPDGNDVWSIPYLRDILPDEYAFDMHALLQIYLDYYFPSAG